MNTPERDEIDLQELAVRIIRYFKSHLTFILVATVLGTGAGIVAYQLLPKIYISKMVVLSDLLTKAYGERIDQQLNDLIREENIEDLAAKLELPKEKVKTISSIDIECIVDAKSPNREPQKKDETFFIVTVNLRDRAVLPDLQKGLLSFLRNNEYVKGRAKYRAEQGTAMVDRIEKELQLLDSMKQLLLRSQPFKGDNVMLDPATLFTESVNLTKTQWDFRQEVEFASSMHLVEGFTVFQKPKSPKLRTLMAVGFLLGLFGSIGLLTLKHLIKLALA